MNTGRIMRSFPAVLLAGSIAISASADAGLLSQEQEQSDPALTQLRSMAEAQHEIVMLLIRKKEFAQAAAEANKIFQMRWPADQESLLVKELLGISNQFQQYGQETLALQLLNDNQSVFKSRKSLVDIYKEMGYLSKRLGRDDEALDYFKRARELESSSP